MYCKNDQQSLYAIRRCLQKLLKPAGAVTSFLRQDSTTTSQEHGELLEHFNNNVFWHVQGLNIKVTAVIFYKEQERFRIH